MTGTSGAGPTAKSGRGSSRRGRWLSADRLVIILLFVVWVGLLVVLACVEMASDVEVTLRVSQVSFPAADERISRLFNSVEARFLTLSRFERVSVVGGELRLASEADARAGGAAGSRVAGGPVKNIVPKLPLSNVSFESVTLNSLSIPTGSTTTLFWSELEPNSLKLSLDKSASGDLAGGETLLFSCTECQVEGLPDDSESPALRFRLTGAKGQVVRFKGSASATLLVLMLPEKAKLKEQNIALKEAPNFSRMEDGRLVSTVLGGKVRFEDLGKEFELAEGTFLDLGGLENGAIKTVAVDQGIDLTLSGRAGRLFTGTEAHKKSRLPSVLEWLRDHYTLKLFIPGVLSFPTVLVIFWWLRRPVKAP